MTRARLIQATILIWISSLLAPYPLDRRSQAADDADDAFQFRDVSEEVGLRQPLQGMMGHAAAWGDVNQDGRPDLFVGTFADRPAERYQAGGADGPVPNMLLLNRRDGFELLDQPPIAWLGRASGSVFADLDNDGRLDLYVSNNGRLGHRNLLYRNLSNNRFELLEGRAELPDTSRGVGVLDFDGDGRLDLLVLGTVGKDKTRLYRNLGQMQFEASRAIPPDATGLGVACGDLTGNGWPDIVIGGPTRLFVNLGEGRYREAVESHTRESFSREDDAASCGVAMGDVDRDGDLDILLGSHHKRPWVTPNSIRLLLNHDSTPSKIQLEDVSRAAGIMPYPMKVPHVEIRDFDNDGWPDLYTAVVTIRDGTVHPAIYKNLGPNSEGIPQFQETAFVHQPDYPASDDYQSGMSSREFYERLQSNRKVMYFAPGPSADFNNDGQIDLFLPSWFPEFPSLLLKNETDAGNYLRVRVRGKMPINSMGIGSIVRAYPVNNTDGPTRPVASEAIAAGYGFCSGQLAIAHLGLGDLRQCHIIVTLPQGVGEIELPEIQANQTITIDVAN